jgi:tetratricopeptide (TPR) repeat protein
MKDVMIDIHHHGYSNPADVKRKVERNMRLMEGLEDDPTISLARCNCLIHLSQYDKAVLELLKMWDNLDPNEFCDIYFTLPNLIGTCYLYRKDYGKAIEWFNKADGKNVEACYHKGLAYMRSNDMAKAMHAFYDALKVEKISITTCVDYHFARIWSFHHLVRLLIGTGHHHQAAKVAELMARTYPEVDVCLTEE